MGYKFMAKPLHTRKNLADGVMGEAMSLLDAAHVTFGQVSDSNPRLMSKKAQDNVQGHYPAGGSFKQVWHFRQLIRTHNFEQYNYGPGENEERYGHRKVRPFNLSAIKVPTVLISGKTDLLASPGNYNWLDGKLSENVSYIGMKEYPLGHMGILMPNNRKIFIDLFDLIKRYNTEGD